MLYRATMLAFDGMHTQTFTRATFPAARGTVSLMVQDAADAMQARAERGEPFADNAPDHCDYDNALADIARWTPELLAEEALLTVVVGAVTYALTATDV